MQLQMAAVQLQQYQAGLEQAAHQHGETLRAKMREVENMEYATQQEAVQHVRLFEENISREAWGHVQRNNEEMQAYTNRCESYVQYELGELQKYKSHAELVDRKAKDSDLELRQHKMLWFSSETIRWLLQTS